MTNAEYDRIKAVVLEALERPPDERAAFLRARCAGDAALWARAAALAGTGPGDAPNGEGEGRPRVDLLPPLVVAPMDGARDEGSVLPVGGALGQYRIVRFLGRGAMGAVYEAQGTRPARLVALKVLADPLPSGSAIRRFEYEAEVLARLEHPGIARLYEAGTHEGPGGARPYFAMELVRGDPVTAHADGRGLSVRQRLELAARVCEAVDHAHLRGIVHRDLKPSNILVDERGDPRVIDFGIARAEFAGGGPDTAPTAEGRILGTPEYMAPEQARGEPGAVDHRADVFSLGVVVYQMLSRQMPRRLGSGGHLERLHSVRTAPCLPLASIDRAFRGDLNLVVMGALELDPSRRYPSAGALAADLRAVIEGRPVSRRPAGTWSELGAFARRHRRPLAAAAGVMAALVLAAGAAGWQAVRATRAEARARAMFRDIWQATRDDEAVVRQAVESTGGYELARRIIRTRLAMLERLAREAPRDRRLAVDLAGAYTSLGMILGGTQWPSGWEHAEAIAALRRAKALATAAAARSQSPGALRALYLAGYGLGEVLFTSGDAPAAADEARELFDVSARELAGQAWDGPHWRDFVAAWPQGVEWLAASGAADEARARLERAAALVGAAPEPASPSAGSAGARGVAYLCLGRAALLLGDAQRALGFLSLAEGPMAAASPDAPEGRDAALGLADIERYRARALSARGDWAGAAAAQRRAMARYESAWRLDEAKRDARGVLAMTGGELAATLLEAGRPAEAVVAWEDALAHMRAIAGADPLVERYQDHLAKMLVGHGGALHAAGVAARDEAMLHRAGEAFGEAASIWEGQAARGALGAARRHRPTEARAMQAECASAAADLSRAP